MSRVYPQQSPETSPQKSPMYVHSLLWNIFLFQMGSIPPQKSPNIRGKALQQALERALWMGTDTYETKRLAVSKAPNTSTKAPYISVKEPYISAKKNWNESLKESTNKPYVCAQSLPRHLSIAQSLTKHVAVSKVLYLPTKEPYINENSPETSPQKSPMYVHSLPWNSLLFQKNPTHPQNSPMGWLRSVGSIESQVSPAKYRLFYRALLQKRRII